MTAYTRQEKRIAGYVACFLWAIAAITLVVIFAS
jgi:hypothetical protein